MNRRGPGRRCAICGEPVTSHGTRALSTSERVLLIRNARTRQDANASLRAAQRVCPLVPTITPKGLPQRYTPQRLIDSGIRPELFPHSVAAQGR